MKKAKIPSQPIIFFILDVTSNFPFSLLKTYFTYENMALVSLQHRSLVSFVLKNQCMNPYEVIFEINN